MKINRYMIKGTRHNAETINKISSGVKKYYENETPYQRELRIGKLKQRKFIEKTLYEKYMKG